MQLGLDRDISYFSHGSFSFVLPKRLYCINPALIVTGESGADSLIFPYC